VIAVGRSGGRDQCVDIPAAGAFGKPEEILLGDLDRGLGRPSSPARPVPWRDVPRMSRGQPGEKADLQNNHLCHTGPHQEGEEDRQTRPVGNASCALSRRPDSSYARASHPLITQSRRRAATLRGLGGTVIIGLSRAQRQA
jgi:hypothetical protein